MRDKDIEVHEVTAVTQPTTQQVTRQIRVVKPAVETGSLQEAYDTKKVIFRSYQVIWYVLGVIEVLLTFRFLLKILGANLQSGFTDLVYSVSNPLALPFAGILGITGGGVSFIEWSTLIAMAVYAVVAYGIVALFQLVKPTNQEEVNQTVDSQ